MSSYKEYQEQAKRKRRGNAGLVVVMLVLITLLTVALAYVASRMLTGRPLFDPIHVASLSTADNSDPVVPPSEGDGAGDSAFGTQLMRPWNTTQKLAATLKTDVLSTDAKMLALPSNGRVSRAYFNNALFIGDSLTQGLAMYDSNVCNEGAVVAAFKGTSPKMIVQNGIGELPDKSKVPMLEYIQQQAPGKIYVGIGTNALISESDEGFVKYYADLLDVLMQTFPGIPIYVQSVTPVTAATSASQPKLDNDRIRLINNHLALQASQRGLYYLNLHEVLADETGCLREDIAGKDGMHLRDGKGYAIWVDYLQTHTAYSPLNLPYLEQPYNA